MDHDRLELLGILKAAQPALAEGNNQLQALSHFWFDGERVSAFDGMFGIRVDLETDFKGGVLGHLLVGVLEKSSDKIVALDEVKKKRKDDENGNLVLTAGEGKFEFALKPIDSLLWNPKVPTKDVFDVTDDFIEAIESVLFSVGVGKVMSPEQKGVTVIQNGAHVDLYTTDTMAISQRRYPVGKGKALMADERAIFPTLFCEQLCKVAKKGFKFVADSKAVYCTGQLGKDGPEILLFSELIDDEEPVPFDELMGKYLESADKTVSEPGELKSRLERAAVLLGDGYPIDLSIDDEGYMVLKGQSPFGRVDDELWAGKKHPPIKVKVDVGLLKRGLTGEKNGAEKEEGEPEKKPKAAARRMAVTPDCVVITGPEDFWHVVATK
jgi:hypothetical protein